MLKTLTKNTVIATILLSSISAFSYFNPVDYAKFQGYNGDGSFVETPAHVGDYFGYVIAILPAEIITEPQRILNYDIQSDKLGAAIMTGSTKTFGAIFGGPSYGLKAVFYDLPIACCNLITGSNSNNSELNKTSPSIIVQKPLTDHEKKALGMSNNANKKNKEVKSKINQQSNSENTAQPQTTSNEKSSNLTPSEMKDLGISYKQKLTPDEEKQKQINDFAEKESSSSSWSQPSLPEWINETPNSSNK